MRAWRWPARVVIIAAVLTAIVVDDRIEPPVAETVTVAPIEEPRPIPASTALTSTWFCPVVAMSADDIGVAVDAVIRVVNLRSEDVPVTVTAISPTTQELAFTITVAAGTVADIDMAGRVDADRVAAIVEAPGGGIAVSRRLESSHGGDVAPCAPGAGKEWTIAAGDTQRDALERLVVFNPFPDDAIIDVLFATEVEAGAFQAADLRAIVVPGENVVSIDLGEAVRRRDQVSVNLVARSGRVVVDRVQTLDGSEGRTGMAVALGSVAAANLWYQPGVTVDAGTIANVHVHNPNDVPAEIDIAAESSALFATGDPIGLTVPARDSVVIPIVATGGQGDGLRLEVDAGLAVGVVVESANGIPVVVDIEWEVVEVDIPQTTTTTTAAPTTTTTTRAPTTITTSAPTDDGSPDSGSGDETTTTTGASTTTTSTTTTTTSTTTTTTVPDEPLPELRPTRAGSGVAHSLFIARLSSRWLLVGDGDADVATAALVHNPGTSVVTLSVSRLDGTLIESLELPSGSSIRLPITGGADVILIEASAPVAAGVVGERVGGVGVMLSSGFPMS